MPTEKSTEPKVEKPETKTDNNNATPKVPTEKPTEKPTEPKVDTSDATLDELMQVDDSDRPKVEIHLKRFPGPGRAQLIVVYEATNKEMDEFETLVRGNDRKDQRSIAIICFARKSSNGERLVPIENRNGKPYIDPEHLSIVRKWPARISDCVWDEVVKLNDLDPETGERNNSGN